MSWTALEPSELPGWISSHQEVPPPSAYTLSPPEEFAAYATSQLRSFTDRTRWTLGGLSLDLGGIDHHDDEAVLMNTVDLVLNLDKREAVHHDGEADIDTSRHARVRSAVTAEYRLDINGVPPAGPGGRVTHYGRARRIDVAFHMRNQSLGGWWRKPDAVAQEALAAFGGELGDDERMRAAFGYYEASGWERQDVLRPVFVVLAEHVRRGDEPRWRLASVHAATDVDDAPPTAGIETVTGCA